MENHKHCKICKIVIEFPSFDTSNYYLKCQLYNKVEICISCILLEAINKWLRKKKNKPEGMEFGRK